MKPHIQRMIFYYQQSPKEFPARRIAAIVKRNSYRTTRMEKQTTKSPGLTIHNEQITNSILTVPASPVTLQTDPAKAEWPGARLTARQNRQDTGATIPVPNLNIDKPL
jgi:hypothetical protein